MKEDNIIRSKTYDFALKIIKLNSLLTKELREFTISNQILRSGTSIGANVEEAIGGISRKDFRAKLAISYKESRETHYWLRLLVDSNLITQEIGRPLIDDCEEIQRILGSILKTLNS